MNVHGTIFADDSVVHGISQSVLFEKVSARLGDSHHFYHLIGFEVVKTSMQDVGVQRLASESSSGARKQRVENKPI